MITGWTSVKTLVMIMLVKLWWFKGYSVKTMTASDSLQIGIPLWCPGTLFSQDFFFRLRNVPALIIHARMTTAKLCSLKIVHKSNPLFTYPKLQTARRYVYFFMSGNGFQVSWNTVSVVWDFRCNISLICSGEKRFLKISGKNLVIFFI